MPGKFNESCGVLAFERHTCRSCMQGIIICHLPGSIVVACQRTLPPFLKGSKNYFLQGVHSWRMLPCMAC